MTKTQLVEDRKRTVSKLKRTFKKHYNELRETWIIRVMYAGGGGWLFGILCGIARERLIMHDFGRLMR